MSVNIQTTAEQTLAQHLVTALGLEGIQATDIAPTTPLFGTQDNGLGLDSIDALEIALMVQRHYGIELRSEDPAVRNAFASLRALNNYVLAHCK